MNYCVLYYELKAHGPSAKLQLEEALAPAAV